MRRDGDSPYRGALLVSDRTVVDQDLWPGMMFVIGEVTFRLSLVSAVSGDAGKLMLVESI